MSVHISFFGFPSGYMVSDWKFLYCPGVIGRTTISFSPNKTRHQLFLGADVLSLSTSISRYPTVAVVSMCKASSNKRNPDFSRKYRGSSKGKRQSQEKENAENLEDNLFSSKNGSLVSLSNNNQRFSATATPGRREKEIVELFRKVQSQLRERAAIKEEKRVESAAQLSQGERGTVDSLLKLLRKHSAAQGKKSSSDDGYDLDQPETERTNPFDEPERSDLFEEEQNSSFFGSDNLANQDVVVDEQKSFPSTSRPISSFKRKSPVPKVKFQPVFSAEEEGGSSIPAALKSVVGMTGVAPETKLAALDPQPRHLLELEHESSMKLESLDAKSEVSLGRSDSADLDETDPGVSEPSMIQGGFDLSSMKLSELKGLAKSRGIKGYTKLKKMELLELLSVNNA